MTPPPEPKPERHLVLSFQTRLNLTLLAAAIIPLGIFGVLLLVSGAVNPELGERLLLFMFAIAVVVGVLGGSVVGSNLVAPFREISGAVSRVSAGDMSQPIPVVGDDVLAQLAESHNRLASDADRRNRQLGMILAAVESAEPRDGVAAMADRAARDAERAFGFIAAEVRFVDPDSVEPEERIPGVSVPIRAELRAGDERLGLLLASLPATRTWERADQTLLDLYASEIGVAIRNAELFNQVQDQNRQLRQLSEVKDDFLRGVSHNLQTPLTSIKSNAEALAATQPAVKGDA
ncbi:MAG TPA: HAMP domain-containing protein, partial [Candidatus Saccharimonadia bacterium]|nr:HAMP domain-containing protein [Candidatus Saccharimonadia bacterium]